MNFKYQIESKSMFKYINHKQTTSKALENEISSWRRKIQPLKERKSKSEKEDKKKNLSESRSSPPSSPSSSSLPSPTLYALGCFHPKSSLFGPESLPRTPPLKSPSKCLNFPLYISQNREKEEMGFGKLMGPDITL